MYEKDFEIKRFTTFKIGGKIREVFFPQSVAEFCEILKSYPDIKVFGNLSNTLVSTYGYDGRIVLTTKMDGVEISATKVVAEAGVKGPKLSQIIAEKGLSGFEFMIGFPTSIGGAVCMNASAHNQAISDKLLCATCYSPEEGVITLTKEDLKFEYRKSVCQSKNLIVLSAEFNLEPKPQSEIKAKMDENLVFRKSHQPSLVLPNCGSVFKNPSNDSAGRLLDSVGAKQMSFGGAKVWENHANFIVNTGGATSLDVLSLMYKMQQTVKKEYNIILEPEIRFLGTNNEEESELCQILYQKMPK